MAQLLSPESSQTLAAALSTSEPIVYRENGHRSRHPDAALKLARAAALKIGVTRVADISNMSAAGFPVFQSTRPTIYGHSRIGQNTGSQGKGLTAVQAEISCLMEALETFCLEPREVNFIRGSHRFLRGAHFMSDPRRFLLNASNSKPTLREPLMWTEALHVSSGKTVLVPAEAAFFPFASRDFGTKSYFNMSSNGLASGGTYLEAVVHALYEVIERDVYTSQMIGKLKTKIVLIDHLGAKVMSLLRGAHRRGLDFSLLTVDDERLAHCGLSYFVALVSDGPTIGWGISAGPSLELTATRALSEAMQSLATAYSSSREDLRRESRNHSEAFNDLQKKFRVDETPLDISKLKKSRRAFTDLRDEYRHLLKYLSDRGCEDVYIANLTRREIDIPVVKLMVPGLDLLKRLTAGPFTEPNLTRRLQYSFF